MNDQDKSSPGSPASSSASDSPSPDALDSGSVRELSKALHGIRQGLDDSRELARAQVRKGEFREQMMVNAIEKNTAAVKGLSVTVDRALRLQREVVRAERQVLEGAAKKLEDATGKFQTPAPLEDEITSRGIKLRWATLAKYAPIVAKIVGLVVTAAAAAYGFFEAIVHKFRH